MFDNNNPMIYVNADGDIFHLVPYPYVKNTPACSGCAFMVGSMGGLVSCRKAKTCTPKNVNGRDIHGHVWQLKERRQNHEEEEQTDERT